MTVRAPRLVVWLLTRPIQETRNEARATGSRFPWRPVAKSANGCLARREHQVYQLTPLDILHGLTGLTFIVPAEEKK